MPTIVLDDMTEGYLDLFDQIRKQGTKVAPRGMETYELEDVLVTLTDPRVAMPAGVGRKLSKKILAAESMQWLAGISDLVQLDAASRGKFSGYSDDGHTLYGAYGPRAYKGLARAVRLLEADPDSRQAVVSLWNNKETDRTKDLPCTVNWGFRIRDGKLNMSTTMRAWDAYTGVAYDLPAMTRIQSAMAWALQVEVGTYNHYAHSLHYYAANEEAITKMAVGLDALEQPPMLDEGMDDWKGLPLHRTNAIDRWSTITDCALVAYMGVGQDRLPSGFAWYAEILSELHRNPSFCRKCRYYLPSDHMFCDD